MPQWVLRHAPFAWAWPQVRHNHRSTKSDMAAKAVARSALGSTPAEARSRVVALYRAWYRDVRIIVGYCTNCYELHFVVVNFIINVYWLYCLCDAQIPYIVETFTLPVGIKGCRAKVLYNNLLGETFCVDGDKTDTDIDYFPPAPRNVWPQQRRQGCTRDRHASREGKDVLFLFPLSWINARVFVYC